MPGENNDDLDPNKNQIDPKNLTDEQKTYLKTLVDVELAPIKEKLNGAYGQRDEALRKLADKERADQEAEAKRLEAEGKKTEAAELRLAQEKAARDSAEAQLVELKRDGVVRSALLGIEFRNTKSADVAFREVVSQLVKDDKGNYAGKNGETVAELVATFIKDEDNEFLLKPKANSGGGGGEKKPTPGSKETSLFKMSQADVIAGIADGTIKRKGK